MTLRIGTILLICCAGCVLAQYGGDGGHTPPKKPLLIPGARRIKQPVASPRISSPSSQTSIINQRFRRPIPINRPRPSIESIPELPVFTSGIRGSRPSSAINLEQNDEPSLPIQTIQQPHIVHAQSIGLPHSLLQKPEVKPVNEENEKDEDVVQVIANLGQVSTYGAQGNLLTPTPLPLAVSTVSAYGQLQSERQQENRHHDRQQEQRLGERVEEQRQHDRQHEQRQHERQQELRHHDLRQQNRPQGNFPTPAPLPAAVPTVGAYGHLQSERQQEHRNHDRQQEQRLGERVEEQRQHDRQHEQRQHERQQEHRQHDQRQQERQQERLQDRQQERQHQQQDSMGRQLEQRQQQEQRLQQQVQAIQYRPAQQIARSSANVIDQVHQVIAPVQYRPQKPARLQKQQQQQHHSERNEYDINEARPVVKQRAQVAPKKSKPHSDYYEGRTKKPVAQVIRRYREETADGSIIWGFENDDGSFKEEMIGIDCITRGKYGYVDPDGLRREYTYETGIKCDEETQQQQDQDILNTFVDYQENKLVLPSGKTIDLSSMGKKQARRPSYRNL
ncbi:PAX-interacting protein 1 [Nasonia vitripennis]|uniref:Uncharacterized protein n=1 Tax=Nasonia vitripennis TaxID=7425 RepID=A0A7M7Q1E2_NASVI|nr:PAX-interacting protein 1 [Nasonia vitripennis]